jgi:hypothetical protein
MAKRFRQANLKGRQPTRPPTSAKAEYCIVSQQDRIYHVNVSEDEIEDDEDRESNSDGEVAPSPGVRQYKMGGQTVTLVERDPKWMAELSQRAELHRITNADLQGHVTIL